MKDDEENARVWGTAQRSNEQAPRDVSRQLINAQEKERRRIARVLHDDICQRLAVLAFQFEQAAAALQRRELNGTSLVEQALKNCSEITGDIQTLSHELHSSKLEYLGLAPALRGFCKEFSQQHEMIVDFSHGEVPNELPPDLALSFFRVAQESLSNARSHSGAQWIKVELHQQKDVLQLTVTDNGSGFCPEDIGGNGGVGLVSMSERMQLVGGALAIDARPGSGTKIRATVALPKTDVTPNVTGKNAKEGIKV